MRQFPKGFEQGQNPGEEAPLAGGKLLLELAEIAFKKAAKIFLACFDVVFGKNLPCDPRVSSARDFNLSEIFFQGELLKETEPQCCFTCTSTGEKGAINIKENKGGFNHREVGALGEELAGVEELDPGPPAFETETTAP